MPLLGIAKIVPPCAQCWETVNETQLSITFGFGLLVALSFMARLDVPPEPSPVVAPLFTSNGTWLNPRCGEYGSSLLFTPDTPLTRHVMTTALGALGANTSAACGAAIGYTSSEALLDSYASDGAVQARTKAAVFFNEGVTSTGLHEGASASDTPLGYTLAIAQPITGRCLYLSWCVARRASSPDEPRAMKLVFFLPQATTADN